MKPMWVFVLGWVLLGPRPGAAKGGSSEEASFYYGNFPPGFSWGVGSSAYQTGGAWDQDGKGPSIWDAFTHAGKGKVVGDDSADAACDSYYKVQEDISLLRELQVSHYRFSLSWPRLLPTGIRTEQMNAKGVKFYSDFIDSLLKSNIPLHHWGLPQAHAQAWHSYNSTWRSKQQGLVGISLNCDCGEPVDISNPKDTEAAEQYLQFRLGWFANPIYADGCSATHHVPLTEYSTERRKSAEQGLDMSRLRVLSLQEKSYIKGTSDFLGLGHFSTRYITERKYPSQQWPSYHNDRDVVELDPNWPDLESPWLYSLPWGFRRLLNFAQTQYNDPPIYVTENGAAQKLYCAQLCDQWRIQYLRGYINEMLKSYKRWCECKSVTSWSLLDKFEWEKGYAERYGFYYVEFNVRNKPRYPKASVQYFKIITANGFPNPQEEGDTLASPPASTISAQDAEHVTKFSSFHTEQGLMQGPHPRWTVKGKINRDFDGFVSGVRDGVQGFIPCDARLLPLSYSSSP